MDKWMDEYWMDGWMDDWMTQITGEKFTVGGFQ
jgi:hypothetical protein